MPHSEIFQGLACHRLSLTCGDTLLVAEQGAQVLSWVTQGDERLFLSPANVWDGQSAIRGGVPVCFPQFNQRGDLPKHGFARNMRWTLSGVQAKGDQAHIDFTLRADEHTRAIWPQEFVAQLQVHLQPGQLLLSLSLHNTDKQALLFTGALHTYLAVDDIDLTDVTGLQGQAEWDAVTDVHGVADEALYFDGEFDRVYDAAPGPVRMQDGRGVVCVEQSPSWGQSVVWNPGPEKCATLADMPSDGFARMVCVEAAQVFEPILVPAGQQWLGWQRLTVS
jgi:glucose-6-phosphate 1-epimerase